MKPRLRNPWPAAIRRLTALGEGIGRTGVTKGGSQSIIVTAGLSERRNEAVRLLEWMEKGRHPVKAKGLSVASLSALLTALQGIGVELSPSLIGALLLSVAGQVESPRELAETLQLGTQCSLLSPELAVVAAKAIQNGFDGQNLGSLFYPTLGLSGCTYPVLQSTTQGGPYALLESLDMLRSWGGEGAERCLEVKSAVVANIVNAVDSLCLADGGGVRGRELTQIVLRLAEAGGAPRPALCRGGVVMIGGRCCLIRKVDEEMNWIELTEDGAAEVLRRELVVADTVQCIKRRSNDPVWGEEDSVVIQSVAEDGLEEGLVRVTSQLCSRLFAVDASDAVKEWRGLLSVHVLDRFLASLWLSKVVLTDAAVSTLSALYAAAEVRAVKTKRSKKTCFVPSRNALAWLVSQAESGVLDGFALQKWLMYAVAFHVNGGSGGGERAGVEEGLALYMLMHVFVQKTDVVAVDGGAEGGLR